MNPPLPRPEKDRAIAQLLAGIKAGAIPLRRGPGRVIPDLSSRPSPTETQCPVQAKAGTPEEPSKRGWENELLVEGNRHLPTPPDVAGTDQQRVHTEAELPTQGTALGGHLAASP